MIVRAIPVLSNNSEHPFTLISDRDKGLTNVDDVFPYAIRTWCCWHLAENVKTGYGGARSAQFFWRVARARSVEEYERAISELRQIHSQAADYISNLPPSLYATAFHPGHRYGHDTSNVAESLNKDILEEREMPVLTMLDTIWHKEMDRRFNRFVRAQSLDSNHRLTQHGQNLLLESLQFAEGNQVTMSSLNPISGRVRQPNRRIHIVNVTEKTCTCRRYQDNEVPCGHAMSIILRLPVGQNAPINYMPEYLYRTSWLEGYRVNLPPVNIEEVYRQRRVVANQTQYPSQATDGHESGDSESDYGNLSVTSQAPVPERVEPPLSRRPRGRPSKKRKRKGDQSSRPSRAQGQLVNPHDEPSVSQSGGNLLPERTRRSQRLRTQATQATNLNDDDGEGSESVPEEGAAASGGRGGGNTSNLNLRMRRSRLYHCGVCGGNDHYAPSCREPHT